MAKKNESANIFIDYFEDIEDPRTPGGNTRYKVDEILLVALCAILCGADSWRDLVEYGKLKIEFLRKYFPYDLVRAGFRTVTGEDLDYPHQ